jgi:hypothetical protein
MTEIPSNDFKTEQIIQKSTLKEAIKDALRN